MTEITDKGLIISPLDERLNDLIEGVETIFGVEISLDPDDLDLQTLAMFAESTHKNDLLAEWVKDQFDVNAATGDGLSRLVQLNRLRRKDGAYSVGVVTVTGTAHTQIPKGSQIKHETSAALFETTEDTEIPDSGSIDINIVSIEMGPIAAASGALTKINTPIYGWQSVTNSNPVTPGKNVETDEQLRIRRAKSTATPAQSIIDSIRGELSNLQGVIQAEVYENKTRSVDANGQIPNSIHAIVLGGADQDIWDTLRLKTSLGVAYVGDEIGYSYDSRNNPNEVKFSRPDEVPIYIIVNLTIKSGWPSDGADRIKDAIVNWGIENQLIGEELIQSRLYDPINTVPGHSISSLYIGTAADPTESDNITISYDTIASFDQARITVNVP